MKKSKLLFVFGTRPEAIKLAVLIKKLKLNINFEVKVCTTGQHLNLLDDVLHQFSITKDYDLNIFSKNQSLETITVKILQRLPQIFCDFEPDYVIVHGDTTTSFSAALSSFYNKIKVIHIEAGLRTSSINDPFPEELNRRLISKIAKFHFAPSNIDKQNLLKEGICHKSIIVTGNTVIDSLNYILNKIKADQKSEMRLLKSLNLDKLKEGYIVLTIHRKENQGSNILKICKILNEIEINFPNIKIIFPIHPNPILRNSFKQNLQSKNVIFIEPLNYIDFIILLKNCLLIITDSGGIQEEAPSLNKRVIVLREETERQGQINHSSFVTGLNKLEILNSISTIISENSLILDKDIFGDGKSYEKIISFLERQI